MLETRVTFSGSTGGQMVSIMHWTAASEDVTSATAARQAAADFWAALDPYIVNEITWLVESAVGVRTPAGLLTGRIAGGSAISGQGGEAGEPLPWATQGLISWYTGSFAGGKEIRGRTYILGPSEEVQSNGTPNSTYIAALATAAQGLLGASGVEFAIWSRATQTVVPATAYGVPDMWAVLRSRRD